MALKFGQVLYVDFEYDIDKLEATNKDIAATYRRDFPMYRRMSVDANLTCIKEWLRINERAALSHADSTPPMDMVMISVLEKSTTRPCPSVSRPSSSTCNSTLNTSGCAFSTSSNSTT